MIDIFLARLMISLNLLLNIHEQVFLIKILIHRETGNHIFNLFFLLNSTANPEIVQDETKMAFDHLLVFDTVV